MPHIETTTLDERAGSTQQPPSTHSRRRNAIPGVGLLVVYWVLSLLNSPAGFLGTDTGGKVATLRAMADNGTYTSLDVGYWAAQWDPQGLLHPLYSSVQHGDQWIQVTTLPMMLLGEPLYRLGGYRLTLLLPMLGAVACAYAARALARRLAADTKRQWWAFWIVGLASPVAIYALDFWEHTIGLALMTWGTIALVDLLDTTDTRRRVTLCGLAGLAFGSAATMRTEALIYLTVAAAVVGLWLLIRDRSIRRWIAPGVTLVIGAVIALGANWVLTRAVLGNGLREGRTTGAAEGLGTDVGLRLREGLVTTFGLPAGSTQATILVGVAAMAIAAYAVVRGRSNRRRAPSNILAVLMVCLVLLYVIPISGGLGFIPSIIGAAPLAMLGAVALWWAPPNPPSRVIGWIALAALPMVWAFQWTGGAGPQWGGRYVMTSMFLLVVAGVVALPKLRKPIPQVLIGLSVAVTVFGLAWLSVRSHDVARTFDTLEARDEPVLVADLALGFYPREGGATYGRHRWLTAPKAGDRDRAAQVVEDAGFTSFALIDVESDPPPERIGSFVATAESHITAYTDVEFRITTYTLDAADAG